MTISVECPKGGRHELEVAKNGRGHVCGKCGSWWGIRSGATLNLLNAALQLTADDADYLAKHVADFDYAPQTGQWRTKESERAAVSASEYAATWRGETDG